jgi:hypothetical protein
MHAFFGDRAETAPGRWAERVVEDVVDDGMEAVAAPVLGAVEAGGGGGYVFVADGAGETIFAPRQLIYHFNGKKD